MKRRFFSALTAAAMLLCLVLPVYAAGSMRFLAPGGYNDNDYQKLVSFLETEDAAGVKNGEKLSAAYDPEDPETWTDGAEARLVWTWRSTEFRLKKVFFDGYELVGALDLSSCAELDEVNLADARLDSIALAGTKVLRFGAVEKEGAGSLAFIQAEYMGEDYIWLCGAAVAVPDEGAAFIGWFTEDGDYITSDLMLQAPDANSSNLVARFTEEGQEYGYNEADCAKLRAFLETADAYGVKNGEKLCTDYDPEEPSSWDGVYWRYSEGELFLRKLEFYGKSMHGTLDVSGCAWLEELSCGDNGGITDIDVTNCTALTRVSCPYCAITELELTGCSAIENVYCSNNPLERLDVSDCPLLVWIYCLNTPIRGLDFTQNPRVAFNSITAEGAGSVGVYYVGAPMWAYFAVAYPEDGASFRGWYNEDGEFVSGETEYCESPNWNDGSPEREIVARFEGHEDPVPGDANSDGEVSLTDALLVLRHALSIFDLPESAAAICDMDGSGSITIEDALLILRFALGLV